jgi:transposase
MAGGGPPFIQKTGQERPGQRVEVWFQDETRVGQQGTLTRCWAPKGSRPTAVKQTEYEWVYLFGAVNPLTGESSALLAPSVDTAYMNHHLRFISERANADVHIVLVLDQAGWHLAKDLQVPPNITLHPLPPYSPELNPVERLWAYLKSHYLSNRAYRDYDDIFNACGEAWNQLTAERLCSICRTDWIQRMNQS